MGIVVREVSNTGDIKTFVRLPFQIYKNNAFWVPPIIKDEIKSLQPENNPAYEFCKAKFWLAFKDEKPVGRIGAIINQAHIDKTGELYGRISRVEFIDDEDVSKLLFLTAESWLRSQGMKGARGPLGFTNLDTQGLLIEGFDHMPSIASVYHLPYYQSHFEKLGYQKEIDWVEFRLTIEDVPEQAKRLNEVIKKRYGLEVIHFNSSKELYPYGKEIFNLFNNAFAELFSVVALNERMKDYYMNKYFKLLNPKFIKVIKDKEGKIVAFIIALPSLSEAMQKANGKLLPFGIFPIMKAMKKPKVIDLLLTAIEPSMQGMGVPALLISELQTALIQNGVQFTETTGIFETNHKAIQHWKNYKHIQHKRRRCYIKDFA